MKFIYVVCITTDVIADLIGFNRLGNNIQGHYQARFPDKTRSNYYKQLKGFMIANKADNFQNVNIKGLISVEKPTRMRCNLKRRRKNLYYAHMISK